MKPRSVRIVALTEPGLALAKRIQAFLPDAQLSFKPKPFAQVVQQAFNKGEALIMICATGIVVRTLSAVLRNKQDDPPVLVLDEMGSFVIPLLSGHEGGANDLAHQLAEAIGAQCVMTTANAYIQPIYTIGMGCERGCPEAALHELLQTALAEAQLVLADISSISSIDIKADEQGLIELGASLNKPFQTFDKIALAMVESQLSVKSDYIFKTVGVYGVAESAALVAAQHHTQQPAELVLNKIKSAKATCAIARSYAHTR